MYTIGAMLLDYDKHFRLTANIDLSDYTGTSFFTIGLSVYPFTGVFDGNGHTISNFTYTSTGRNYIGVFGYVDGPGAEIKNLGLVNPDVDTGITSRYVGSLVAYNAGTITNCYVSGGNVSAGDDIGVLVGKSIGKITNCYVTGIISGDRVVGGLVGDDGGGTILDSYAAGSVEGRLYVGGLAGIGGTISKSFSTGSVSAVSDWGGVGGLVGSGGLITECYSTASVSASDAPRVGGLVGQGGQIYNSYATGNVIGGDYGVGGLVGVFSSNGVAVNCYSTGSVSGTGTTVGGLVGSNSGMVSACFWDKQTSGRSNMCGGGSGIGCDDGNGKTTAEMQDINTFLSAGWCFVNQGDGPNYDWAEPPGGGYMILWWQLPEGQLPALPSFSGGTGEAGDPYLIATSSDLNRIGHNPRLMDKHFKLISDIDLAGVDFFFIGSLGHDYSGVFNGNGHTISNFTYTSNQTNNIGLFRSIRGKDAEVKDLGLINPNIDAGERDNIGSLVGLFAEGTVSGCYVDGGGVSGSERVGGLVGYNEYGLITECRAVSSVSGYYDTGGLVGASDGTMTNCRSSGIVFGVDRVGGLVGISIGTMTHCYSTGSVSGTGYRVGGLAGTGIGVISDCHSSSDVSGSSTVGGLMGACGGTITNCYSTGIVSGTEYNIGGLVGEMGGGTITNCYSTGDVSGVSGTLNLGGLVGGTQSVGTITNCYATGKVTGTTYVGGLMGWNGHCTISASFWDVQTSTRSNMCGSQAGSGSGCDNGNGKTKAEMQMASTFISAGWDFVGETFNGPNDIWRLCEDLVHYPRLACEFPLGDFICQDGVNFLDYSFFASHWLEDNCGASNDCDGTDLDQLGSVGTNDLGIFVGNWLASSPSGPASNPNPTDGALGVSRTADLSWTAGRSVTSYDVYLGTSSPGIFQGNQTYNIFYPGKMDSDTTYYWRIDAVNKWGINIGKVWSFTTVFLRASNPNPTNGAAGVSRTADLSWTAGSDALSHDVYFGTSNPPPFIGNQSLTTFDPGTMAYSTTYYWRIDEVRAYDTITGAAWSFTTMSSPPPM